jgi:hypothetical protein
MESIIRKDFSLLLNTRGWRTGIFGGEILKKPETYGGSGANEEEEGEDEEEEEEITNRLKTLKSKQKFNCHCIQNRLGIYQNFCFLYVTKIYTLFTKTLKARRMFVGVQNLKLFQNQAKDTLDPTSGQSILLSTPSWSS